MAQSSSDTPRGNTSGTTRGNINIYGMEDKRSDNVSGPNQSHLIEDEKEDVSTDWREMKLKGEEATTMYHFFRKKDLKTIAEKYSGLIERSPAEGQLQFLIIKYKKKYMEDVTKHIVKMRLQMKELQRKDLSFKAENAGKLVEFLEQPERLEDKVCYIPDIANSKVEIVGKSYEDIGEADHKLKFYLGEVRATGARRQGRRTSESGIDSSIDRTTLSYADVTRFPKSSTQATEDRSRGFVRSLSSSSSAASYGSSADDFSFETTLNNGFVLKVYKASITKLEVEAIVNAANENMMHGGGVARVISDAAGWRLDDESAEYVKRNGNLNVAENIVTTAGKLSQYRGVIHAVGPVWYQYRNKVDCLDDLSECVYNVLETCQKESFKTVAMSAISAGIFAVPKELCADMYVDAAVRFSKNMKPGDCPRELHIIDIDTSILKLVEVSVKKWQKDSQSINARVTAPKFLEENPHLDGQTSSHSSGSYGHRRGQRGQGHGRAGQGFYSGQARNNDKNYNGNGNVTGQASVSANTVSNKYDLKKTLRKKKEEIFRWGGRAQIFVMDETITVKIFKGEVSKASNMDAVVCSMDENLIASGFIATSLKIAGGYEYEKRLSKMVTDNYSFAMKGKVFKCKGGKLGVGHVMHIVMDKIVNAEKTELERYEGYINNILNHADEWSFTKLVIPLFGTGMIQTNDRKLKACCVTLLKGLDGYLEDSRNKGKVREVHLVNNNDLVCKILTEVFDEAVNMPFAFGKTGSRQESGARRESGADANYQASGKGYSERRLNESRDDGKSSNYGKKNWEHFENGSSNDRPKIHGQGRNQFENSQRGKGSTTQSSDKKHPSGHRVEAAGGNTAASESSDDDSSGVTERQPGQSIVPKKEEKQAGNLMIIEN